MTRIAPYILFSLSGLMLFYAISGDGGILHLLELREQKDELKEKKHGREAQIASLRNTVFGLRKDPDFIESAARRHLSYSKPGEIIYTFDD